MEKKYYIMVADDEPSVREILKDLILALGDEYNVYPVADSFEALHFLRSMPIDCILVDIFMPGLNGLDFLKKIRPKYRDLMVVIITGQPSYDIVLEALRLGATDFLAKPISLSELRKILDKLKQQKEQAQQQTEPASRSEQLSLETMTEQVHQKMQEQYTLHALGEQLANIRSTEEFYTNLANMALILTGGIQSTFFLYDQALGRLQAVAHTGDQTISDNVLKVASQAISQSDPLYLPAEKGSGKQRASLSSISLPVRLRGELLGVLHVNGAPGKDIKTEDIAPLQLLIDRSLMTLENLALHESASANLYDTLRALINSLEARDPYSRHHSVRVTRIAAYFAEKMGLTAEMIDSINLAGPLHDIGKIGIPDAILLKQDALVPEEIEIMRQHPVVGDNIVAPLNLLPRERSIILHHHERWDGLGYPMGLAGENIPYLARIIALADAYDAITTDRPYRLRRTSMEALAEIQACAGTQFDPELAGRFVDIMGQLGAADEISGDMAPVPQSTELLLSRQQFDMLKKKYHSKIIPLKDHKRSSAAPEQSAAARTEIK